jgi:hypothetical protein
MSFSFGLIWSRRAPVAMTPAGLWALAEGRKEGRMMRGVMAGALAVLLIGSTASAQAPAAARLRWQPGQVLLYKVEHATFAADVAGDTKTETKTLLKVTKRWQVLAVDAAGVATLQLSLTALAQEQTTPKGEVLRYDSANPDKSTPELRAAFGRLLNVPLAVLRVDGLGKVVEVKESKFGPASNYENELPFVGVLPGGALAARQTWERAYRITLAPPLGTGEKHDAVQRYACKGVSGDLATVTLTTEVKSAPPAAGDAVPLWQQQPQGELVYDLKAGRLHRAALKIDKEAKGHQGEGSSCRFQSTYTIEYAGDR